MEFPNRPSPVSSVAYRGRFAPSPTGPLHFGSLVAALGSWLDARSCGGEWLLRIEDVDEPRCRPEAEAQQLAALEAFGLTWDGPVWRQSERKAAYRDALEQLKAAGQVFPCACTRRELADSSLMAIDGAQRYPGTCRHGLPPGRAARAWRLIVLEAELGFVDAVQGPVSQQLARDVGDFVLLRADGYFAYQLAVVVDDSAQEITHVVRGADLLDSTPRQIWLQRCLGLPTPDYAHLPVAVNAAGEKLSKQTLATAVDPAEPVPALLRALRFLGQEPVPELRYATRDECLAWATTHWRMDTVPRVRTQAVPAAED